MGQHARISQDILFLSVAEAQIGAAELPLPERLPALPAYMQQDLRLSTPD
eukprot:SAG31_NODE_35206_length_325_cov_0.902655_1_plen_49_part_01